MLTQLNELLHLESCDVGRHVQRGCHLDFSQALADAVKTAAERAEEVDNSLKTFMFVIPKARTFTELAAHYQSPPASSSQFLRRTEAGPGA